MFVSNERGRAFSMKPLAGALALALGVAGINADTNAATNPGSLTFAQRVQNLQHLIVQFKPQLKQYQSQHPGQRLLFPHSTPHTLTRHHKAIVTPNVTQAVTSCVDNSSSATTAGTLRYAVLNAADGDVIDLSACKNSTITLTQGALPITVDNLTVTADATSNNVTISGGGTDRVFYDTGSGSYLTLSYLTVSNGTNAPASGDAYGGCIFAPDGGVALYNTTITGCKATSTTGSSAGGGIASEALYMQSSTISGNTASTTANGKYEAIGGGAAVEGDQTSYIYSSHIQNNTAQVTGGFIADGGGIFAYAPFLKGSVVSGNVASATSVSGTPSHPYIAIGGGVVGKYNVTLVASTVSGNSAQCVGAGAYCSGGGVVMAGEPEEHSVGQLYIAYSTISDNHSDFFGGGITSKYALNLVQSTISGNTAEAGGGLLQKYYGSSAAAYVGNSTIAANTATNVGGGIYDFGDDDAAAPITLVSTLVANNTAGYPGADIYASSADSVTISGSANLVMAASSNVTLPAGTLSADPLLQALASNGGLTQTQALTTGSPAIGTGSNPNNYTSDQRGTGFPRETAGLTDIGAFQVQAAPAEAVPAPALSAWGLSLLAGLLGWFGWRRRKTAT